MNISGTSWRYLFLFMLNPKVKIRSNWDKIFYEKPYFFPSAALKTEYLNVYFSEVSIAITVSKIKQNKQNV